jgi:hypothetical protein
VHFDVHVKKNEEGDGEEEILLNLQQGHYTCEVSKIKET